MDPIGSFICLAPRSRTVWKDLKDWEVWPDWSKCDLVGGSVSLRGLGFEVSKAMLDPVFLSLPVDQDVVLS